MADNILHKLSLSISASLTNEDIENKIRASLSKLNVIYSYLIYAKYKNDTLVGWVIEYNISQIDKYNTLCCDAIIDDIIFSILNNRDAASSVVSYKQPSIELMIDLYRPLISKLALSECNKWPELEYEDAFSMCQLTMLKLYRQGYYVHKRLLKRSFENYVLMELRHNKNKPEIVSLDQVIHDDGNNEAITLSDTIPDKKQILAQEKADEEDALKLIFNEVKDIIVELIGERQFEQLMRDYGNKHTTPWSRKKMQQLKDKFKQMGINWKSFNKYR